MKIAIISDIHNNLKNLQKTLNYCKENSIQQIICCGDIDNLDSLKFLSNNFSNKIFLVKGNAETYTEEEIEKIENIDYRGLVGEIEIENIKIIFSHKIEDLNSAIKKSEKEFDFAFFGHSHKPWLEKQGKTIISNPGNIANIYYQPTFSVLDTNSRNLELKILNR